MTHDDDRAVLDPLIAQLPRSIEPPRDLWPAIRARSRRRRQVALAVAAGLLIALLSSAVTAWLLTAGPAGSPAPQSAQVTVLPRESAYLRATATLSQELAMRRDELAPETIAILERNLAVIDRAIAESRAALARDPSNDALAELLWTSYERKVSFLEQAARIASPG